jgi:hypothetical protein
MRTLRLFIPAVAILLWSCSGDAPAATEKTVSSGNENPDAVEVTEGTPEAMGVQICNLVIANDNKGLTDLIITQEQMTNVITNSSVSQMGKQVAIGNIPTEISKMRVDYTSGMTDIRKNCEAAGVEWSNCKMKDVKCEVTNPTGYNMAQMHCVLECNGMEYKFTVSDVVETESGWRLGGTMYYGDIAPKRTPVIVPQGK